MSRIQPGYVALACEQPLLRVAGFGERYLSVKEAVPADHADTDKRQTFATRANLILAFVECSEELRPKLRDAIIDAMLWAQTQP
jgi:hypothetical protein